MIICIYITTCIHDYLRSANFWMFWNGTVRSSIHQINVYPSMKVWSHTRVGLVLSNICRLKLPNMDQVFCHMRFDYRLLYAVRDLFRQRWNVVGSRLTSLNKLISTYMEYNHILYTDNFYTSIKLGEILAYILWLLYFMNQTIYLVYVYDTKILKRFLYLYTVIIFCKPKYLSSFTLNLLRYLLFFYKSILF